MEHNEAKQIPVDYPRGLSYKCKKFTIGDENLVRTTLFSAGRSSIAYWFVGEIHILNNRIIPSSSRTDFEDNFHRNEFYDSSRKAVSKVLNSKATEKSAKNSISKVNKKTNNQIEEIKKKQNKQKIYPENKELIIKNLKNSQKSLINSNLKTFDQTIKENNKAKIKEISELISDIESGNGVNKSNFIEALSSESKELYDQMINVIKKWFLKTDPDNFEVIISLIHKELSKQKIIK